MEQKLIKVLEHFLSLHEADEIMNMVLDDNVSTDEVIAKLEEFGYEEGLND